MCFIVSIFFFVVIYVGVNSWVYIMECINFVIDKEFYYKLYFGVFYNVVLLIASILG